MTDLTQDSLTDEIFRALGDPTRRAIIESLGKGPASVSELAEPFDMSLPAIYQHLQILRDAKLVRTFKKGRVRTCQLEPQMLRHAEEWLAKRRALWEHRLDELERHLSETKTASKGRQ